MEAVYGQKDTAWGGDNILCIPCSLTHNNPRNSPKVTFVNRKLPPSPPVTGAVRKARSG